MNTMKWIKLSTSLFEDDKLLLLEQMEDGQMLQLLWVKILCLAGKHCQSGKLMLTADMPYTSQMLSTVLRMEKGLIDRGLELLCAFGMLTFRDGFYTITNWNRHQSMTAYERKLSYDRDYQARQRRMNAPSAKGYGTFGNVFLTDAQYGALCAEFPVDAQSRLDRLSEYMESSGKQYRDPLSVIRRWAKEEQSIPKIQKKRSFVELAQEA